MIRWLLSLIGAKRAEAENIAPVLRALVHSQALSEAVAQTASPLDDLVLRLLRVIVPAPELERKEP